MLLPLVGTRFLALMTLALMRMPWLPVVSLWFDFEVHTNDLDVKRVRTGARPIQRGATMFSRTRIGKARIIGSLTGVR